jgi:hypothetical protein
MRERRKDENERIAEILAGTQYDERKHSEADCRANPGEACCRDCGRPMTEFERNIYRAL